MRDCGPLEISDDEEEFARPDEAEILAGYRLDSGGIVAQSVDAIAKRVVFSPHRIERGRLLLIHTTGAHPFDHPAVADQ